VQRLADEMRPMGRSGRGGPLWKRLRDAGGRRTGPKVAGAGPQRSVGMIVFTSRQRVPSLRRGRVRAAQSHVRERVVICTRRPRTGVVGSNRAHRLPPGAGTRNEVPSVMPSSSTWARPRKASGSAMGSNPGSKSPGTGTWPGLENRRPGLVTGPDRWTTRSAAWPCSRPCERFALQERACTAAAIFRRRRPRGSRPARSPPRPRVGSGGPLHRDRRHGVAGRLRRGNRHSRPARTTRSGKPSGRRPGARVGTSAARPYVFFRTADIPALIALCRQAASAKRDPLSIEGSSRSSRRMLPPVQFGRRGRRPLFTQRSPHPATPTGPVEVAH